MHVFMAPSAFLAVFALSVSRDARRPVLIISGTECFPSENLSAHRCRERAVLVEAFCESGVDAKLVHDLAAERWRKLVWNIPFNGLAVAEGGLSVDRILAIPALNARCRALMRETILAATALGHFIESEYAELQIERTYPMGAYKPSTLVDWLAGKELEIEAIWGEPLRQATKAGLSVPNLEVLI